MNFECIASRQGITEMMLSVVSRYMLAIAITE